MRLVTVSLGLLLLAAAAAAAAAASGGAEDGAAAAAGNGTYLPVVMMHGVTGSKKRMDHVVQWVQDALPGVYVKNMEVGDGAIDSVVWSMNRQVEAFAEEIAADPRLAGGFNLIGYSQGGLVTRGYVERYLARPGLVHNYITWSGPHGGQFGIPAGIKDPALVAAFDRLLNGGLTSWLQKHLSFASYWRDPYDLAAYARDSEFLADINNVRPQKNATYAANLRSVNQFTMLYSTVDNIVVPKESGWFGAFAAGSNTTVVPLQKQALYTDDWIGLRALDERGALALHATDCKHHDYPEPVCKNWFDLYTLPLLNQTVADAREARVRRGLPASLRE